jgi:hypothetical protein
LPAPKQNFIIPQPNPPPYLQVRRPTNLPSAPQLSITLSSSGFIVISPTVISDSAERIIGNGSFGVVFEASKEWWKPIAATLAYTIPTMKAIGGFFVGQVVVT